MGSLSSSLHTEGTAAIEYDEDKKPEGKLISLWNESLPYHCPRLVAFNLLPSLHTAAVEYGRDYSGNRKREKKLVALATHSKFS